MKTSRATLGHFSLLSVCKPIFTRKFEEGSYDVASDQGLHYLLIEFSIKAINRPDTPKMTNRLAQYVTMDESTSIQEDTK